MHLFWCHRYLLISFGQVDFGLVFFATKTSEENLLLSAWVLSSGRMVLSDVEASTLTLVTDISSIKSMHVPVPHSTGYVLISLS